MNLIGQTFTVVGGGIGGLAAARALAMRGAQVEVIERASEIAEVGAGIQVSPNGMVVIEALGLRADLDAVTDASEGVTLHDAKGRRVLGMDWPAGGRFRLVHRADLIRILEKGARDAGVAIRLGCEVESVSLAEADPGRAMILLKSGDRFTVTGVVGADGLHSKVRAAVEGVSQPFFTGQTAWRALVPAAGQGDLPRRAQVFMGPGRHLVAYPLRGGTVLNLVAVEEQGSWDKEGWFHEGDPADLRAAFAGFGGPVAGWLATVDRVHRWGLFRHPVAQQWHAGGCAALLGDAAHPTLPFLAQGACLALEDAWVLAESLSQNATMTAGLVAYQHRRRARAVRVVDAATSNARNYHLRGLAGIFGHNVLRVLDRAAPSFMPRRFDWLYSYDVTRASE